ncbi:hypothetical protein JYT28_01265 [Desulfobulbus sp. AH-315-M07]|nr:hypothetical protein [Desulfobulbus sp. AH-315-M07]
MQSVRLKVELCSETGSLQQVLIHRPGDEVVRMTHRDLEKLLFDDILSPDEAVREHDVMIEIIRAAGAHVVDIVDLLESALERAGDSERLAMLDRVCAMAGAREVASTLHQWDAAALTRALVCGVSLAELKAAPTSLARLRRQLTGKLHALRPIPNLMFMRDPCVAIGNRVLVGRMATDARAREPELVSFAIEHSGAFDSSTVAFPQGKSERHARRDSIEGGDILVLSDKVIFIGCSERTSVQTISRVASEALFDTPALERIYVAMMPEGRTVMHLDTILTQIDEHLFLGHAPLISGDQALAVARLERDKSPCLIEGATILDVLREELGSDTALVPCGGDDPLHREREQWTDGANALCLAPGHIILYARNNHTIAALEKHDFVPVPIHMVYPPQKRAALVAQGMKLPRAVFSFPGSELSRARGGGRCLTMPLQRAAV